jgi:leucine dehydrogenase
VINTNQFRDHEHVVMINDRQSGLKAIIAVHDTSCGPAAGGCRMYPYDNEMDALNDALRLSRGMSFKNAVAGLPLGGGKAVIIGNPARDKSEKLFKAFGAFVEELNGKYISAEDVGISVEDMEIVSSVTAHVAGLDKGEHASGDPSPFTADGVFYGIKAAVKHRLGKDDLKGLTVAVQGAGHVGYYLCKHLHAAGVKLLVADVNEGSLKVVQDEFGAKIIPIGEITPVECDVLAPCALGATLNEASIPTIKASVVAGAANNQLATDEDGQRLKDAGILYAPDYVINAGGIINVSAETTGNYDVEWVNEKVDNIYHSLTSIFKRAEDEGRPTNIIADRLAMELIEAARR